jgi:hypothetical protein
MLSPRRHHASAAPCSLEASQPPYAVVREMGIFDESQRAVALHGWPPCRAVRVLRGPALSREGTRSRAHAWFCSRSMQHGRTRRRDALPQPRRVGAPQRKPQAEARLRVSARRLTARLMIVKRGPQRASKVYARREGYDMLARTVLRSRSSRHPWRTRYREAKRGERANRTAGSGDRCIESTSAAQRAIEDQVRRGNRAYSGRGTARKTPASRKGCAFSSNLSRQCACRLPPSRKCRSRCTVGSK